MNTQDLIRRFGSKLGALAYVTKCQQSNAKNWRGDKPYEHTSIYAMFEALKKELTDKKSKGKFTLIPD